MTWDKLEQMMKTWWWCLVIGCLGLFFWWHGHSHVVELPVVDPPIRKAPPAELTLPVTPDEPRKDSHFDELWDFPPYEPGKDPYFDELMWGTEDPGLHGWLAGFQAAVEADFAGRIHVTPEDRDRFETHFLWYDAELIRRKWRDLDGPESEDPLATLLSAITKVTEREDHRLKALSILLNCPPDWESINREILARLK